MKFYFVVGQWSMRLPVLFTSVIGPVHMIPLTGTSRLPRRIFPCVHMEYFVPLAEMKLHCSSIKLAKLLHFSQATQILSDFSVFLRLFTRKSIASGAYLILVYKQT